MAVVAHQSASLAPMRRYHGQGMTLEGREMNLLHARCLGVPPRSLQNTATAVLTRYMQCIWEVPSTILPSRSTEASSLHQASILNSPNEP